MDVLPFENGMINLREYEIVPESVPPDETPRQFVLRMTGQDILAPTSFDAHEYTWEELRENGLLSFIGRIIQIAYLPRIRLRKRDL